MINKNDCYILLADIQNKGIDTKKYIDILTKSPSVSFEVLQFINDNRPLKVAEFYENIRKNYNKKRSALYINIMKEITDTSEVLTTLSAMLTQLLLFSKKLENKQMFLRHARAEDIVKVLQIYLNNYDLTPCLKLLRLIKADIIALEMIARRRDLGVKDE